MSVPRYLIEQGAKEFDELVRKAHARRSGPYADEFSIGLQLIADMYRPSVRNTRIGDRRRGKKN